MRPLVPLAIGAAALVLLLSVGTPDAAELARRLDAGSAAERDAAAQRLAELGEDARDTLEALAAAGSPEARRRSRALLGLLGSDADTAADVRRLEARALVIGALRQEGRIAAGSARDARLAALGEDGASAVAETAARRVATTTLSEHTALTLARHPSRAGVATLAEALRRERVVGSAAVRAARALEDAPADLLDETAREHLASVLAETGDPRRRAAAALLLAFEPGLGRSLADDPDARVRLEAARALGRCAGAGALRRLCADLDADVREAALRALARVPGAPRPEPAVRNAEHADAAVRAAAADLLGSDAIPGSLPVLARLATDDSARVRAAAERSLATLGR